MVTEFQIEIWDEEKFKERVGNNISIVEHLLNLYLEEVPHLINQVEAGIQVLDYTTVFQSAHKLKGMSANIKASQIQEVAYQLELAGRAQKSEELSSLADKLKEEIEVFVSLIKESHPNLF